MKKIALMFQLALDVCQINGSSYEYVSYNVLRAEYTCLGNGYFLGSKISLIMFNFLFNIPHSCTIIADNSNMTDILEINETITSSSEKITEEITTESVNITEVKVKAGECPVELFSDYLSIWCRSFCDSDGDCPGTMKCCGSCFKRCKPAFDLKTKPTPKNGS